MKTNGIKFFKRPDYLEEGDFTYYAMINCKITSGLMRETYNQYGIPISPSDAGDYSVDNPDGSMHYDLEKELRDNFDIAEDAEIEIESILAAPEHEEVGILIDGEKNEEMSKFATKYARENSNYEWADYINYWDGHNWRSIIVNCEIAPEGCDFEEVEDEDIIRELTAVVEQFDCYCDGASKIETIDGYEIGCSRYEDDPWSCYLRKL